MKRKGAYEGQLLSLEGTYELAAKPETVRIADTPECIWNYELCRAVVTKERGKHLLSMGVRLRLPSKTTCSSHPGQYAQVCTRSVLEDDSPLDDGGAVIHGDETAAQSTSNPSSTKASSKLCSSTPKSPVQLVLFPEEAVLLVEQGAIILR